MSEPRVPAGFDGLRTAAIVLALSLLVLFVYREVGGHSFVSLDDESYVTRNPHVLKGLTLEGVSWAFSSFEVANWHPLTWLSHMMDVSLFGPDPGWHHRVNVAYHLLNTNLLFLVLWGMTGSVWPSALAAALFGIHPLHVESVAWVSERKDVLSTLFWILAMGAYLRYVRKPSVSRYLPVFLALALGLMCKPMLVTLPFALLLLDFWPLRRAGTPVRRLLLEKVPLMALSAASCALTVVAQSQGGAITRVPFSGRAGNAVVSVAAYLRKTAWPSPLSAVYPLRPDIPGWEIALAVVLVVLVSLAALGLAKDRPYLATGWLWFLGTLVPVLGLVQVGSAAMADRYSYVPLIGIFVALSWLLFDLAGNRPHGRLALGIAVAATLPSLALAARNQVGHWRDDLSLYSHAATVTRESWLVWNNLGAAQEKLGRLGEAIASYEEALRVSPAYAGTWSNLGRARFKAGDLSRAASDLRKSLGMDPGSAQTWSLLGTVLTQAGERREAVAAYREAVRLDPADEVAWNNLGFHLLQLGETSEAVDCFRKALSIRPDYAVARENLDESLRKRGVTASGGP